MFLIMQGVHDKTKATTCCSSFSHTPFPSESCRLHHFTPFRQCPSQSCDFMFHDLGGTYVTERAQSLKAGCGLIFDTDQLYPFHFFQPQFSCL